MVVLLDELWKEIFCFLTLPNLFNVMKVSHHWNMIVKSEKIWKNKCIEFGLYEIIEKFHVPSHKKILKDVVIYYQGKAELLPEYKKFIVIKLLIMSKGNLEDVCSKLNFSDYLITFEERIELIMEHAQVGREGAILAFLSSSRNIADAVIFVNAMKNFYKEYIPVNRDSNYNKLFQYLNGLQDFEFLE